MKKFISIALAVIMVLAACPLTLFAAATSTAASDGKITANVASIWYTKDGANTKYGDYNTLDAAVDALGALYSPVLSTTTDGDDADTTIANELYAAAGSPVIKLNGNFDGAAVSPSWVGKSTYNANAHYTVVIDGAKSATENYTISCGAITLFSHLAWFNFTLKNTNLVFERGTSTADNNIIWSGNAFGTRSNGDTVTDFAPGESFTVFENCVIDQNSTLGAGNDQGGLFKLNGAAKAIKDQNGDGKIDDNHPSDIFNVTFTDCTINSAVAVGLQVHWGASANVSLENTTWTHDGITGTGNNNDCILKSYDGGIVNFNIDGTSKLIAARGEGSKTVTLIRTTSVGGGDVTVNLAEGAELNMQNTATSTLTAQTYIALVDYGGYKETVNDNGAVYKANAASQKLGITLPTFMDENDVEHLWKNGEEIIANPYKKADATAEVTLKHEANPDPLLNPNNVCYIKISDTETKYFTSLASAITAAESGATIVLMKDLVVSSTIDVRGKSITIDGNNKTIDSSASNIYMVDVYAGSDNNYDYTFTIKNATIKNQKGIRFRTKNVVLENCTITTTRALALRATMTSNVDISVTLKNTNWTYDHISSNNVADEPFMLAGDNPTANFDLTLINSTITGICGKEGGTNVGNNSLFNINNKGNTNINLDATSKVAINGQYLQSIFADTSNAKINLTLAEGATMEIVNALANATFVYDADGTVVDNGANWVIGAEAAKKGISLPAVKTPDGKALKWSVDGVALVKNVYQNEAATEAITLKLDANAKEPFAMINGAGLKTEGEGLGISFGMNIDQSIIDLVGPDATYGMLIAPSEYTQFGFDALNEGQYIDIHTTAAGIVEGKCVLGITGFPADKSVFLKLTVIGYASYYDTENSKTVTYYTPDTVEISLYDLALIAAENGYADNANVKTILGQLK